MTSSISGTPPSHCCAMPRSTPSNFSILEQLDEIDRQNVHYDYDAVDVVPLGPVRLPPLSLLLDDA